MHGDHSVRGQPRCTLHSAQCPLVIAPYRSASAALAHAMAAMARISGHPPFFQASESAILVESDAWHPTNIRNVDMAIVGRVVGRRVSINHQMPYAPAEKPCVFWCPRRCAAAQPPDSVRNLKPALFK